MTNAVTLDTHQRLPAVAPLLTTYRAPIREIGLIGVGAFALYLLLAVVSHSPSDPSYTFSGESGEVRNWVGASGAYVADLFLFVFGWVAYMMPLAVLAIGVLPVVRGHIAQRGLGCRDALRLRPRASACALGRLCNARWLRRHAWRVVGSIWTPRLRLRGADPAGRGGRPGRCPDGAWLFLARCCRMAGRANTPCFHGRCRLCRPPGRGGDPTANGPQGHPLSGSQARTDPRERSPAASKAPATEHRTPRGEGGQAGAGESL
ncbi:MAG: hypothetical protein F4229_04050 [Gammaproteobacteria bacterium]|nr:hypothetical protein [Gammaproteobacteria bacterium]